MKLIIKIRTLLVFIMLRVSNFFNLQGLVATHPWKQQQKFQIFSITKDWFHPPSIGSNQKQKKKNYIQGLVSSKERFSFIFGGHPKILVNQFLPPFSIIVNNSWRKPKNFTSTFFHHPSMSANNTWGTQNDIFKMHSQVNIRKHFFNIRF